MTATEMEDVLRNLDLRMSRVEQILPTLATKEDLKAYATKEDLKEALKPYATLEALNAVKVLVEDVRDSVGMLAAHLADISQRLPPRA